MNKKPLGVYPSSIKEIPTSDTVDVGTLHVASEYSNTANVNAPSNGVTLESKVIVGKRLLSYVDPNGQCLNVQPHFGTGRISMSDVSANSTSFSGLGHVSPNTHGTASAVNLSSTNVRSSFKRVQYQTGATAGSSAGVYNGTGRIVWRGNAVGLGGFFFVLRFAIQQTQAGFIFFAGLCEQITVMNGTSNPSTIVRQISVSKDSGDTTFQFMFNADGATATKIDTGVVPDTTTAYMFCCYCKPNDSSVYVGLIDIATGIVTEVNVTSTTANIPLSTTFLAWQLNIGNNTAAASANVEYGGLYVENIF